MTEKDRCGNMFRGMARGLPKGILEPPVIRATTVWMEVSERDNIPMPNYRVSLSFVSMSDPPLDEFAAGVVLSLTGNPAFPTPLVPLVALGDAQAAFHDALLE